MSEENPTPPQEVVSHTLTADDLETIEAAVKASKNPMVREHGFTVGQSVQLALDEAGNGWLHVGKRCSAKLKEAT